MNKLNEFLPEKFTRVSENGEILARKENCEATGDFGLGYNQAIDDTLTNIKKHGK